MLRALDLARNAGDLTMMSVFVKEKGWSDGEVVDVGGCGLEELLI